MSSTRNSIASRPAQSRASARLWGSDSRSGKPSPRTCPGPTASTASAAHTELSTPPLIATTIPPRRSVSPTWTRRVCAIRRVSAAASSSSRSTIVVDTAPRLHRESSASPASPIAKFEPGSDIVRAADRAAGTPAIGQRVNGFRRATPFHREHSCRARATRALPRWCGRVETYLDSLPWYARCNIATRPYTGDCALSIDAGAPGALAPPLNAALLLWGSAARRGEQPAVVERGSSVSYTALRERAAAVGAALRTAGIEPDARVAILLERGRDAAAAFFGTLAAGAIAVVVNEALRPRQIEHVLAHSSTRCLITAGDLLARQPRQLATDAVVLDTNAIGAGGEPFAPVSRLADDVAQIVYTSGSTGLPKGVAVSHANLWAVTSAVVSYLGLTEADRIASLLPFSFVYGVGQLLCAVGAGAALVVERSPLPQQMIETVRAEGVSVLAAVPPLWTRLVRVPAFVEAPLPRLRLMTNAGGHLPAEAVRALRQAQPEARLYLMYGLTEALRCTHLPPQELDPRPPAMGRAHPRGEGYLLLEDGKPAPPGEIGELVYRGPTVTLGYWNDPELTSRVFRPNPQRPPGAPDAERVVYSGDLVRRDDDGFLYFVGRRDRIIKTMGYRVGPDEILSVLHGSGEVVDAVVMGEPDEARGERIVAYVVLGEQGSLERLRTYCGRELPRYLQPARFEGRDALPLLASGKHDVEAVRAASGHV